MIDVSELQLDRTPGMIDVSELQIDGLSEIFNIGVGRAAAGLSQILGDEVALSVPQLLFVDSSQLGVTMIGGPSRWLSMISQDYSGPFNARAVLVFPEENALVIVAQMMGTGVTPQELSEFAQEALCELGNIILNACMSALADILEMAFEGGLPEHAVGRSDKLDLGNGTEARVVLVLRVTMRIRSSQIEGDLLFMLSTQSLHELLRRLDLYLARSGGVA